MAVAALSPRRFVTPEEYLEREREAVTKSEYIAGEILAMSGGTPAHNYLLADVLRSLGNRLEAAGNGCDVLPSDQKVRVEDAGPFFYPDVAVVCGGPTFDADDCLRDPVLIVEVLSDSTSNYDRDEKFRHSRGLASLRHYVLVAQDRVRVEHYQRQGDGFLWALAGTYARRDSTIPLLDLGIDLPLSEVYRRVGVSDSEVPPTSPALPRG